MSPKAVSAASSASSARMTVPPLCELQQVSVRYGARLANDSVSLVVQPGEVVALLGENGAGKSTLLHALYGLVGLSGGKVCYRGAVVNPSPERAIAAGIGLIHQHFLLVPRLTVAENIVLGQEPRRLGVLLDRQRAVTETAALAARYGLRVDPERPVADLSVGEAQRVEILKALYRGARCLLLDEPTAVLTPGEAQQLLTVLRELLVENPPDDVRADAGGSSLVIVTHKLDEVLQVADRAVVMQRGRVVAQLARSEFSASELARAMVGRELFPISRSAAPVAPTAAHIAGGASGSESGAIRTVARPAPPPPLELRDLRVVREGVERVRGVSLTVPAGMIYGIAGVEGNGQSELCAALAGLLPLHGGQVRLAGRDMSAASVGARKQAGLGFLLEDRQRHGLVLDFSLAENLMLGDEAHYSAGGLGVFIARRRLQQTALELLRKYDVRPPDPALPARALSGGNQQKLLLARALYGGGTAPQVLLAAQPTRGVDIGAIESIHRALLMARDRGCAILLVSAELDELRTLCDRIAVMYRGQILAELENAPSAPTSRERLGELLAGVR